MVEVAAEDDVEDDVVAVAVEVEAEVAVVLVAEVVAPGMKSEVNSC